MTLNERLRIESDGDFRFSSGDAGTNYGWIRGWQSATGDMIIGADQSATGTGTIDYQWYQVGIGSVVDA